MFKIESSLNLNNKKKILIRTKEYRKIINFCNISFQNNTNKLLNLNNSNSEINSFLNNIVKINYNQYSLVVDISKLDLQNHLVELTNIYFNKLIFSKDLEFLIQMFCLLYSSYKQNFIILFNEKINYFFKNINLKDNTLTKNIFWINFHILWIISLKFIEKSINIESLNNFLNELINLVENDKNNYLINLNIFLVLYNYLIPLICIDLLNISENNYYKLIKDKNNNFLNKKNYDKSQIYFVDLIDNFNLFLEKNIFIIKKKFVDFINILEKEFYLNFKISNINKTKIILVNKVVLSYKDFTFIINNYFNKSIKFTINEKILIKKNNLLKEFNIDIKKEYYENINEYKNYSKKFQVNDEILLSKQAKTHDNIEDIIFYFNNLNSITDCENLIILIYKYKKDAISYFRNILNNIDFNKKIIFQIIIINKFLLIDIESKKLFLKWLNNFFFLYDNNEEFTERDVNYIKLIIHLIKFGTINILLILNYFPIFINNLNDKKLYFIFKIINNCKFFLKNFEVINKGFPKLWEKINLKVKLNLKLYESYFNKLNNINKEFNLFKDTKPLSTLTINLIEQFLNKSNIDNLLYIFMRLPIDVMIEEINKLFINFIFNNSYYLIENVCKFINKIGLYYPEIKIYFLDFIFEYIIDAISNKDFEKKQDILNVCITISYCFNYNLIQETELIKLFYILINFNNNLSKNITYENFDKKNNFPLQMFCIWFSKLNINNFLNDDCIYLYFFYLQIYILNLEYLDLNIEIQIKDIFNKFNNKFIILNSTDKAEIMMDELNMFYNNNSKYSKLSEIFISDEISKEFSILDSKSIINKSQNCNSDFIKLAESNFLKELNELTE